MSEERTYESELAPVEERVFMSMDTTLPKQVVDIVGTRRRFGAMPANPGIVAAATEVSRQYGLIHTRMVEELRRRAMCEDVFEQMGPGQVREPSEPIEREPEFNVVEELKTLVGVYNPALVEQKIAEIIAKIESRDAVIDGYELKCEDYD